MDIILLVDFNIFVMDINNTIRIQFGKATGGSTVTYPISFSGTYGHVVATPEDCGSVSGMECTSLTTTSFKGQPTYRTADNQGNSSATFRWISIGY